MAKKYQVFISSTFDDLKEHRDAVVKAVLQLGHLPVGMEMFNAGDQTQWETIKSYIDSSDYYLVILAHRYGSKDTASGLSYTEKEYDYAGEQGVPRLGFVIDKTATWPADRVEAKAKKKLDDFKRKVGSARVIKFWDTIDKLAYHVSLSLGNEITINPRIGWVRATEAASPQVAEELARLSRENKELNVQLRQFSENSQVSKLDLIIKDIELKINLGQLESISLKDVFVMACEIMPGATAFQMSSALERKYKLEFNQWDNIFKMLINGFEELQRLGVVINSSMSIMSRHRPNGEYMRNYQVVLWNLTEKGTQLYTYIKYSSTAN